MSDVMFWALDVAAPCRSVAGASGFIQRDQWESAEPELGSAAAEAD